MNSIIKKDISLEDELLLGEDNRSINLTATMKDNLDITIKKMILISKEVEVHLEVEEISGEEEVTIIVKI